MVAVQGNLEVLNELLAFGVEIDAPADDDWRALHYATNLGHWRIIEALLAKGANPLSRNKGRHRPSESRWSSTSDISPEDKEKCLKLLEDAEKAWKKKEKQRLKESGAGRFTRFIAGLDI